jgi:glycosyltransferase involved in cell wall biosynthesis
MQEFCLRNFATRILAVGNVVAEAHQGSFGRRELDVIPNGIPQPEPMQSQARDKLRKEIAGDQDSPIIITVGRFTRAKGFEDMIKAFSLLHDGITKPVLLMVGTGSMTDSIKQRIESLELSQSVILTGERSDVSELLASSDVYASSSHREGLPLAVLEAMMAGLPVVATSVGDIPRVVTEETGVIVPPHQPKKLAAALEGLLQNPERREAMGRAAQQRARNEYSVDAWIKRHAALYREVLSTK